MGKIPKKKDKMTRKMALDLIEFLSAEEDLHRTNLHNNTNDEFVSFIYMLSHVANSNCKHPEWEKSCLEKWQYWHDQGEI